MAGRLPRGSSAGMTVPYLDEYVAAQQRAALIARGQPLASETVRTMRARLTSCVVRAVGHDLVAACSRADCARELLDTLYRDLKPAGARNTVLIVATYAKWLMDEGHSDNVAITKDDVPRVRAQRVVKVYSQEECDLLLVASEMVNPRTYLAVLSLVDTGLRVGELLALRYDHMVLDEHPPRYVLPSTKTEPRLVVLTPRLARVWREVNLMEMKATDRDRDRKGVAQPRRWQRSHVLYPFPWSYSRFLATFRELCSDAGIEYRGLHTLRHTAATRWLAAGADVLAVSKLLGHSNVGTTARVYGHTNALNHADVLGWAKENRRPVEPWEYR